MQRAPPAHRKVHDRHGDEADDRHQGADPGAGIGILQERAHEQVPDEDQEHDRGGREPRIPRPPDPPGVPAPDRSRDQPGRVEEHAHFHPRQRQVEVGVLFNTTGLITGSIWSRHTWGVWWTWDPRLTTTAIMLLIFVGYLLVRAFLEDPDARARVGALVAIVGFVTVPIVYFSVRWWRTLHQPQSSPSTVDPRMVVALRVMMIAFALGAAYLISRRYELARLQAAVEQLEIEPGVGTGGNG